MDAKLKEIIKNSGNNLHLAIANLLESKDWEVDLNSYYYDDTADKPREIDIIAKKEIEVIDFNQPIDRFMAFLFIECKYFTNEIAFRMWPTKKENKAQAIILQNINKEEVMQNSFGSIHHYGKLTNVGKIYDTHKDTDNAVFSAITQTVKSLSFFKDRFSKKAIYYPIVIYAGIPGIYKVESENFEELDKLEPTDLTVDINYTYKQFGSNTLSITEFFVDFVHQNRFDKFLGQVEQELSALKNYFLYRHMWEQRQVNKNDDHGETI